jgi:hypothetical protein
LTLTPKAQPATRNADQEKAANKPKPFGAKPHITKGSIRRMKIGGKKKK